MRYYFMPNGTAIMKKSDNSKYWQGWEKLGPSDIIGRNVKWYSHFGNYFVQNVKVKLPYSNTFFEFPQN